MQKQRVKLAITKSIIIGDPRRMNEGKEAIRTIWGLSQALENLAPDKYVADNINTKLRMLDKTGQYRVDRYLVYDICHILSVTVDELHDV